LDLFVFGEEAVQIDVSEFRLNGGGFALAARIVRTNRRKRESPDTDEKYKGLHSAVMHLLAGMRNLELSASVEKQTVAEHR
jgi:hypothetical protein